MPCAGCDTKPTQITGWYSKTSSAPIITQQAQVNFGPAFYYYFILPNFAIYITACDD